MLTSVWNRVWFLIANAFSSHHLPALMGVVWFERITADKKFGAGGDRFPCKCRKAKNSTSGSREAKTCLGYHAPWIENSLLLIRRL